MLLKDNEINIFLDFCISYKKSNEYFEFLLLQPNNIYDLVKIKQIPELEGLYRYFS